MLGRILGFELGIYQPSCFLQHACNYMVSIQRTTQGQASVEHHVVPILMLGSDVKMTVVPNIIIACSSLSEADQDRIIALIGQADEQRTKIRAAQSGIVLPPTK